MRLPGLTLPGLANAHSHAFHRALRGAAQAGQGTFWTWREQMYQVAARLEPDSYLALARAVYAEMALAGITCVGEFHYLHHGPGGTRYADPNEMGRALIEAAAQAGVRITLIDTCYLSGGLGNDGSPEPLAGPQLRFGDGDGEQVGAAGARARGRRARHARARTPGSGSRSTRCARCRRARCTRSSPARTPTGRRCTPTCPSRPPRTRPAWRRTGSRRRGLLDRVGALGPRTTVVHATHLTAEGHRGCWAGAGPWLCMCPTTEADLADGDRAGPGAGFRGLAR